MSKHDVQLDGDRIELAFSALNKVGMALKLSQIEFVAVIDFYSIQMKKDIKEKLGIELGNIKSVEVKVIQEEQNKTDLH